ncbi:hypothetical protein FF38_02853 [Lucilia cuprina]|uniref:Uncharacterized protein n=1 Tax=Lucilia cuprina TaxID=7375 RepID=A0A0L0CGL3_LUCCU|nr:hypothetical protein FF38_02853 [Lucilia cuprina]
MDKSPRNKASKNASLFSKTAPVLSVKGNLREANGLLSKISNKSCSLFPIGLPVLSVMGNCKADKAPFSEIRYNAKISDITLLFASVIGNLKADETLSSSRVFKTSTLPSKIPPNPSKTPPTPSTTPPTPSTIPPTPSTTPPTPSTIPPTPSTMPPTTSVTAPNSEPSKSSLPFKTVPVASVNGKAPAASVKGNFKLFKPSSKTPNKSVLLFKILPAASVRGNFTAAKASTFNNVAVKSCLLFSNPPATSFNGNVTPPPSSKVPRKSALSLRILPVTSVRGNFIAANPLTSTLSNKFSLSFNIPPIKPLIGKFDDDKAPSKSIKRSSFSFRTEPAASVRGNFKVDKPFSNRKSIQACVSSSTASVLSVKGNFKAAIPSRKPRITAALLFSRIPPASLAGYLIADKPPCTIASKKSSFEFNTLPPASVKGNLRVDKKPPSKRTDKRSRFSFKTAPTASVSGYCRSNKPPSNKASTKSILLSNTPPSSSVTGNLIDGKAWLVKSSSNTTGLLSKSSPSASGKFGTWSSNRSDTACISGKAFPAASVMGNFKVLKPLSITKLIKADLSPITAPVLSVNGNFKAAKLSKPRITSNLLFKVAPAVSVMGYLMPDKPFLIRASNRLSLSFKTVPEASVMGNLREAKEPPLNIAIKRSCLLLKISPAALVKGNCRANTPAPSMFVTKSTLLSNTSPMPSVMGKVISSKALPLSSDCRTIVMSSPRSSLSPSTSGITSTDSSLICITTFMLAKPAPVASVKGKFRDFNPLLITKLRKASLSPTTAPVIVTPAASVAGYLMPDKPFLITASNRLPLSFKVLPAASVIGNLREPKEPPSKSSTNRSFMSFKTLPAALVTPVASLAGYLIADKPFSIKASNRLSLSSITAPAASVMGNFKDANGPPSNRRLRKSCLSFRTAPAAFVSSNTAPLPSVTGNVICGKALPLKRDSNTIKLPGVTSPTSSPSTSGCPSNMPPIISVTGFSTERTILSRVSKRAVLFFKIFPAASVKGYFRAVRPFSNDPNNSTFPFRTLPATSVRGNFKAPKASGFNRVSSKAALFLITVPATSVMGNFKAANGPASNRNFNRSNLVFMTPPATSVRGYFKAAKPLSSTSCNRFSLSLKTLPNKPVKGKLGDVKLPIPPSKVSSNCNLLSIKPPVGFFTGNFKGDKTLASNRICSSCTLSLSIPPAASLMGNFKTVKAPCNKSAISSALSLITAPSPSVMGKPNSTKASESNSKPNNSAQSFIISPSSSRMGNFILPCNKACRKASVSFKTVLELSVMGNFKATKALASIKASTRSASFFNITPQTLVKGYSKPKKPASNITCKSFLTAENSESNKAVGVSSTPPDPSVRGNFSTDKAPPTTVFNSSCFPLITLPAASVKGKSKAVKALSLDRADNMASGLLSTTPAASLRGNVKSLKTLPSNMPFNKDNLSFITLPAASVKGNFKAFKGLLFISTSNKAKGSFKTTPALLVMGNCKTLKTPSITIANRSPKPFKTPPTASVMGNFRADKAPLPKSSVNRFAGTSRTVPTTSVTTSTASPKITANSSAFPFNIPPAPSVRGNFKTFNPLSSIASKKAFFVAKTLPAASVRGNFSNPKSKLSSNAFNIRCLRGNSPPPLNILREERPPSNRASNRAFLSFNKLPIKPPTGNRPPTTPKTPPKTPASTPVRGDLSAAKTEPSTRVPS